MADPTVTLGTATSDVPNVTLGKATADPPTIVSNSEDTGADGGVFAITELTGDKRSLELIQRAMPYRPVSFEGKHRISSTAYGGFAQKTQQPLGAEEGMTTVNGTWKDKYLGDTRASSASVSSDAAAPVVTPTITTARDLAELVDDIRRKGQLLKVTWAHLVRIGRIAKFTQKWLNVHDMEWEIEFDFLGRDESLKTATPASSTLGNAAQQANTAYLDVDDATSFDGIDNLDQSFASAIDVHVTALQQGVLNLSDSISQRAAGVSNGLDATRRAISTCQFIEDTADLLIDEITGRVAASAVAFDGTAVTFSAGVTAFAVAPYRDLRNTDIGQTLAAACAIAKTATTTRKLKNVAGRQRIALAKQSEANVIAVVMIREEQDLRDLSLKYYGTADGWSEIRKFNMFPGSQLEPGTVVLIPAQSSKT